MGGKPSKEDLENRKYWRPDNSRATCELCERNFTLFRRRHHCRACGGLVCNDCSPSRQRLPDRGLKPVRMCNMCVLQQGGGYGESSTASTPRASTPRMSGAFGTRRSIAQVDEEGKLTPTRPGDADERLCSSAPETPPNRRAGSTPLSAAATTGTGGGTRKKPLRAAATSGSASASRRLALIFNPARRRALTAYLLSLRRKRYGSMQSTDYVLPPLVAEIIVGYLHQAYFMESFLMPSPRELYVSKNKCSAVYGPPASVISAGGGGGRGLGVDSATGAADMPTAQLFSMSEREQQEEAEGDPSVAGGVFRQCALYLAPALPSDFAVALHFQIKVKRTSHFYMEVGVVHQSFLPPTLVSSSKGKSGAVSSNPLLSATGGVRVCNMSSTRVPPVGLQLPSRVALTLDMGKAPVEAINTEELLKDYSEGEGGSDAAEAFEGRSSAYKRLGDGSGLGSRCYVDVMYVSVYWDGLSRSVTFSTTDLRPDQALESHVLSAGGGGGGGSTTGTSLSAVGGGRTTPLRRTNSNSNLSAYSQEGTDSSLTAPRRSPLRRSNSNLYPGSTNRPQRASPVPSPVPPSTLLGVPGSSSANLVTTTSSALGMGGFGSTACLDDSTRELRLPHGVAGRWAIAFSCESAAEVKIQAL